MFEIEILLACPLYFLTEKERRPFYTAINYASGYFNNCQSEK
jgi:hypothetical protein